MEGSLGEEVCKSYTVPTEWLPWPVCKKYATPNIRLIWWEGLAATADSTISTGVTSGKAWGRTTTRRQAFPGDGTGGRPEAGQCMKKG